MSSSYTNSIRLAKPATADRNWDVALNANADALDALAPLGGLAASAAEVPSASLNVRVGSGQYATTTRAVGAYAGTASFAVAASSTVKLWLDGSGTLTSGAAFPSTAHVRLATVVTGSSTVSSVTDERVSYGAMGTGLGFVLKAGDTLPAAADFVLDTATGTRLGTAAAQKLGFFGATAIVQPSSTTDLRAALIALGLYATGGATPLDLNGGALTALSLTTSAAGTSTLAEASNVAFGTATGTKLGTGTTQKIGLWNASPIARPSGYTQTYATSTKTLATYTPNSQSGAYTGQDNAQAGGVYAKLTDLNLLRIAYENLRALAENVAQVLNATIDDDQLLGLRG